MTDVTARPATAGWYLPFLIFISGLGGLLAGIDYGIIAGALLYVDKTIPMSEVQQGIMVSIYVGGGVLASLFAGALADLVGRKKMMVAGGLIFITSIMLIYVSTGFAALLVGRVLMGLSGGVVCVVVPLFMAECLPSHIRGRGTSVFQFMMTLGFVVAAWIAGHYAGVHDAAVAAAQGDPDLIFAADNAAWRNMFLVGSTPGIFFTLGALFLKESPRWLVRRGREVQALAVLRMSRDEPQAELELREMKGHGKSEE
ncbi:MAG: MFS transporter, partial [Verrucomicrobiaceae bacterium]